MTKEELKALNKKIEERFGRASDNLPLYRVSWAPDQYEHRQGDHGEFSESGILIRRFIGVKYVPKYPFIGEAYVLEKRVPIILDEVRDDAKMNYEAVIDFPKDKEPWFEAIEWFLVLAMEGSDEAAKRVAQERMIEEDEKKYQREIDYFQGILEA